MTVFVNQKDTPYRTINTTSRSKTVSRFLSPFYVGKVTLYDNYVAKNVENAWQYSKLYEEFAKDGKVTDAYFKWAASGWSCSYANRYPMGKGATPLCSYWDGEYLDYIEARKKIYIPLYAKAVAKTSVFKTLREIYEKVGYINLFDFDGYDHRELGMTYEEVVNNPNKKMGHAFVLAMLLEDFNIDQVCKF